MANGPLGVLGGIFDPLHNGHLSVAVLARDFFKLDQILFVPAGIPPHKLSSVNATAVDRIEMLKRALGSDPTLKICPGEVNRPGISYTVETLEMLTGRFPGRAIHFIIGSDNVQEILTWKRYATILKLVTLCVAHRPGYSSKLPAELKDARVYRFPSPEWGVSSTMVRGYLQKGYSCRHLLPESVIDYIRSKGLYGCK